MRKVHLPAIAAVLAVAAPAGAAILGPHADACAAGAARPAMLVKVEGLKTRAGVIRVQSYGGDPDSYFQKGAYLERVEVHAPATGPVEVCMAVPRAGLYAISVRHDVDGGGKAELADGGGMSGNPNLSLMDVLFKRRPSPAQVQVKVERVTTVPVTLNYIQGGAVKPIATAGR